MIANAHPEISKTMEITANRMYASTKFLPKPPDVLSAGRILRIHRLKMSFQSAYHGISFYCQKFFDEIVTRLLNWSSSASPSLYRSVCAPDSTPMSRTVDLSHWFNEIFCNPTAIPQLGTARWFQYIIDKFLNYLILCTPSFDEFFSY